MNVKEARNLVNEFHQISMPSEYEILAFTEAMNFLIEAENNPEDMMHLGGYYYGARKFDLAFKYYTWLRPLIMMRLVAVLEYNYC